MPSLSFTTTPPSALFSYPTTCGCAARLGPRRRCAAVRPPRLRKEDIPDVKLFLVIFYLHIPGPRLKLLPAEQRGPSSAPLTASWAAAKARLYALVEHGRAQAAAAVHKDVQQCVAVHHCRERQAAEFGGLARVEAHVPVNNERGSARRPIPRRPEAWKPNQMNGLHTIRRTRRPEDR